MRRPARGLGPAGLVLAGALATALAAAPAGADPVPAPTVIATLDLSGPFDTHAPWTLTASQAPPIPDPFGSPGGPGRDDAAPDDTVPGAITLCLRRAAEPCDKRLQLPMFDTSGSDVFSERHYLRRAAIVRARGQPVLLLQTASLPSGDGDQLQLTQALVFRANRFALAFEHWTARNNNQETRFVDAGALAGSIVVAEPADTAPFGYWLTVHALTPAGAYRPVLRVRSATTYGDGNPLPVIDSEMPNIQRRPRPVAPGHAAGGAHPVRHAAAGPDGAVVRLKARRHDDPVRLAPSPGLHHPDPSAIGSPSRGRSAAACSVSSARYAATLSGPKREIRPDTVSAPTSTPDAFSSGTATAARSGSRPPSDTAEPCRRTASPSCPPSPANARSTAPAAPRPSGCCAPLLQVVPRQPRRVLPQQAQPRIPVPHVERRRFLRLRHQLRQHRPYQRRQVRVRTAQRAQPTQLRPQQEQPGPVPVEEPAPHQRPGQPQDRALVEPGPLRQHRQPQRLAFGVKALQQAQRTLHGFHTAGTRARHVAGIARRCVLYSRSRAG